MEKEMLELEQQIHDVFGPSSGKSVTEYAKETKKIQKLQRVVRDRTILMPIRVLHVLQPGRLINVIGWGWGLCVCVVKEEGKGFSKDKYVVDMLLCCKRDERRGSGDAEPMDYGELLSQLSPFQCGCGGSRGM